MAIRACSISGLVLAISATGAPSNYGFQWVTIGAPGNRAYEGGGFGGMQLRGAGRVDYTYRISKLEITTGQWMEFLNAFASSQSNPAAWGLPTHWGARGTSGPFGHYRLRTDVPNAAMIPVNGISWRDAAMYCNWLCNDKALTPDAITHGAYDTSTFTFDPKSGTYNDQRAHDPSARYWIPTLDEWIKAEHFDPSANDPNYPGEGRWWASVNSSDAPLVPGYPSEGGETIVGAGFTGLDHQDVPLGSYPSVRTPWGLLDASGGAAEWTEEVFFPGTGLYNRGLDGTSSAWGPNLAFLDQLWERSAADPQSQFGGLRIAASVPSPSGACVMIFLFIPLTMRQRQIHERLAHTRE